MTRVLITGGAGFIGFHLARALAAAGAAVDIVDNFVRGANDEAIESLISSPNVRLFNRNLLQRGSLHDLGVLYHYIYHCAAILGVAQVVARPYAVLAENVTMLLHVLDLAKRQTQLKRFVFPSTSEVYAQSVAVGLARIPTAEDVPLLVAELAQPRTSYMLSKIYGEALCRQAGIPWTIIRPHNFYGPRMGQAHVIPELLAKAHAAPPGGGVEVFSIQHRRTFCYIDDAIEVIRRAAVAPACEGETLNIGTQSPEISMGELAQLIGDVVGKRLTIIERPPTPGSPIQRCPDTAKARKLTGYTPRIALLDGLRLTYAWYRDHMFTVAAETVTTEGRSV